MSTIPKKEVKGINTRVSAYILPPVLEDLEKIRVYENSKAMGFTSLNSVMNSAFQKMIAEYKKAGKIK